MIKPYYQDEWVTIYHGDCRDILPELPDKSIDLVLTDPPYLRIDMDKKVYDNLGIFSKRLLKDGCFLYAYCGAEYLPQCIKELNAHLTWFWLFNYKQIGGSPRMWNKHLMVSSKPILAFTNGDYDIKGLKWCSTDFMARQYPKKLDHKWEQNMGFALNHISLRVDEGGIVLDPYMGSGTFIYASKVLNRYSIGIELEERYCEVAAKRCLQSVFKLDC